MGHGRQEGFKLLCTKGFEALVVEALRELKALADGLQSRLAACEGRLKPPECRSFAGKRQAGGE